MNQLSQIILADAEQICAKVDLSELNNKTILITGASGLIGNYFLACLRKYSEQGRNLSVAAVVQRDIPEYMNDLLDYNGAKVYKGDITDINFCKSLPQADFIIHAAGYGQPGKFMDDQVKTIKLNTASTFSLFDKLNAGGKFLFMSSSEVYSGLPNPPYKEQQIGTTNTDHPRSCYIEAKRCGEAICNAYRSKGVLAKSARLCLAYGPGTKPNDARVLNSFIFKGLHGNIEMLDRGLAERTYCYVSDAVEILWRILLNGQDPIYNVGGISKVSIKELATMIADYLLVSVVMPPELDEGVAGAPNCVSLDMTKVKEEFKKDDYISLKEGLRRTIEWQRLLY